MPQVIDGKSLTKREHEVWKAALKRAKEKSEIDDPGGWATNAVRNYRKNKAKARSKTARRLARVGKKRRA